MPTSTTCDVLIAGGGLAGLTAACALSQNGLAVTVVERHSILGGRARSWTDAETGDPIHIGPHIFLSEYANMRKLLRMLGTDQRIVWQDDCFVLMTEGQRERQIKMARLPPPFHIAGSAVLDERLTPRDIMSNLRAAILAMRLQESDVQRLDCMNGLALLRSLGVSERFIQRYWSFISFSILNLPLELCSAGALMRVFQKLTGMACVAGFPDGGLGDLFAPQAQAMIERGGGHVLLNAEVRRFTGSVEEVTGVELADGSEISARYCISALTPQGLRAVARPEWLAKHEVFRELGFFRPCPYISTYLWFDRKLTQRAFWAREHDPNDLNCDFYDYSNILTDRVRTGSFIASNCINSERADHLSDDEIVKKTLEEIVEYLPEARDAKLLRGLVNRVPMAIHCPFPGTEQRRAAVQSPVRRLSLAGDWIQTQLPVSMESACASGWMAAEEVLKQSGHPTSLLERSMQTCGLSKFIQHTTSAIPRLPSWVPQQRL